MRFTGTGSFGEVVVRGDGGCSVSSTTVTTEICDG